MARRTITLTMIATRMIAPLMASFQNCEIQISGSALQMTAIVSEPSRTPATLP